MSLSHRRPALTACAAIAPLLLAACGSDLDDRNAAIADYRAEQDTRSLEELEADAAAELAARDDDGQSQTDALSEFYGDDETGDESAESEDEADAGGSFDDPTSGYYDNEFAVPDMGGGDMAGGDAGGADDSGYDRSVPGEA